MMMDAASSAVMSDDQLWQKSREGDCDAPGRTAVGDIACSPLLAVGFPAVAHDCAVGIVTSASEAGTDAAKHRVKTQWLMDTRRDDKP